MTEQKSAGLRFRQALEVEKPLQIIGTVNAYAAMMAKQVGYKAIYLSGAGVANYSYGLPDLGMTSLDNVLEDVRRITERVDTPLMLQTAFSQPFQQSFATGTVLAMMAYALKKTPMTIQSVLNSYTYYVVKNQMNCMNK